jgi:hypothetical protein
MYALTAGRLKPPDCYEDNENRCDGSNHHNNICKKLCKEEIS